MLGPFPVVGDCVSEEECKAVAFIECEPIHHGDLGLWYMPSLEPDEQYAAKWLLADSSGEWWLACKFFAVKFRTGFHIPVGRVSYIISGDPGSLNAELSVSMAGEIHDLRANPPPRADLVVFAQNLLDQDRIVAAIDEHRRHWVS